MPVQNRERLKCVEMTPLEPPSIIVDDAIPATTIAAPDEVQTRPNRISSQRPVPEFTDEEEAFFAAGERLDDQ
jgi:hypothetical protein